jgi:hypothetical protein
VLNGGTPVTPIQSLFALAPSIAEPLGRDSSQECISSGSMLSAIEDDSERLKKE